MIRVDPGSGIPLEDQIRGGFKELVFRGQLKPGDLLPDSVKLGEMIRVSPAVVASTYSAMIKDGFLAETSRGIAVSEKAWSQSANHLLTSVQEFIHATQSGRRMGLDWPDFEAILQMLQSPETSESKSAASHILKRLCLSGRDRPGGGPANCPYCRAKIDGQDIACCFICGTAYHQDCWNESGRCGVYGCQGTVTFQFQE
jgi:DNA-binding transcriptional regulator YhcF (GntR family)